MPNTSADAPAAEPRRGPAEKPARTSLTRNWPVARRLRAVLLLPVLVTLVLGGIRVRDSLDTWRAADDAVRVAELVGVASRYASDAINERDVSVVPLLSGQRDAAVVAEARRVTDADAKAFAEAVERMPQETRLIRRVALVRAGERQLPQVRTAAFTARTTGVQTEESYYAVQHPLMEISNELGYGRSNQSSFGRSLYAISLTQAAESLIRSIGTHLLVGDRDKLAQNELAVQLTAFRSYAYLEQVALREYAAAGTPDDTTRLQQALAVAQTRGQERNAQAAAEARAAGRTYVPPPTIATMVERISSGASIGELAGEGITAESFFASSTLGFDAYRSVQVQLVDSALINARAIADDSRDDAIVTGAAVLAAILLAFLFAAWMARLTSQGMRSLSASAIDIAEHQLPELIGRLSQNDPHTVDPRVRPIPITSTDEIGEVARAFDHVHSEAARLAAVQARLRGQVNAIFTNLSRRNQSLIERQLALIGELEDHETDPQQLENLFRLDHLATRVRRNGENLLVLGGERPGQLWDRPLPLVDVVRAASSEVESYERIELAGVPDVGIGGPAVTDLVHLLAELLENATSFSSAKAPVRVLATRLPDGGVMVEIHDQGIGLRPEDFATINRKLADPPAADETASQHMGLFVVSRLAHRHGIRVQLRPSAARSGATSLVMLPATITDQALPDSDTLTLRRANPAGQAADDPFAEYESWSDHTPSDDASEKVERSLLRPRWGRKKTPAEKDAAKKKASAKD
ncbi:nitrate- and nitrite sensing domain-containing protein [Streptomyces acidiscabies]|uniref:sensor histidine kinase n=1 Tax=Streptomyces acidiscabies TaxID=42234 RepID=UPI000ADC669E|nr:nitrate- and nitrite sensing domain-containing protein [Streptomyces acidiscabies]